MALLCSPFPRRAQLVFEGQRRSVAKANSIHQGQNAWIYLVCKCGSMAGRNRGVDGKRDALVMLVMTACWLIQCFGEGLSVSVEAVT